MEAFEYQLPTKIVFGAGRYAETGALCAAIGKKVLLHYGGGSIKKSGLYDRVKKSLADAGCSVVELGGVQPNPRLALVREGIALCKREGVEMILAVGGGSVIDSAKGIAAGVCYDGDVWDCYTGKAPVAAALPLGVVLTIPAAGSECHAAAVTPRFAIIAPDVFTTLPRNQIANATVDVISHVMERFFSDSTHVTLTDRLCIATMETAMQLGLWLYDHPDDVDAWAEFALTANIAHNGVLGQGHVEDWGAHGLGHELSAFYDVAHGASLAIAIPAWMRYAAAQKPARLVQFAREVMHIYSQDDKQAIEQAVSDFEAFCQRLGLATRLSAAGLADADRAAMAKSVVKYRSRGNYLKLQEEDCLRIYELAL